MGGEVTVGIVGKPLTFNPLFAIQDSEKVVGELIYRSLFKIDSEGKIVPDLAKEISVQDEGRKIEITLKEAVWSDGKPLSAEDVIFSVHIMQNREFRNPNLVNWLGVKIQKTGEKKVLFSLPEPYYPFKEKLTFKILPSHIFQDLGPTQLTTLFDPELLKVGTGPFLLEKIETKDHEPDTIILRYNPSYPYPVYPRTIKIKLFDKTEDLEQKIKEGRVQVALLPQKPSKNITTQILYPPRYFAIFFNTQRSFQKEAWFREALTLALDYPSLLELWPEARPVSSPLLSASSNLPVYDLQKSIEILKENSFVIDKDGKLYYQEELEFGPIKTRLEKGDRGEDVKNLQRCLKIAGLYDGKVTGVFDSLTEEGVIRFQEMFAEEILDPEGLSKGTGVVGQRTRSKLNEFCSQQENKKTPVILSMVVPQQENLVKIAKAIKKEWGEKLGIEVKLSVLSLESIKEQVLPARDYDLIIFGQDLGVIPDPFAFWHSSRSFDPGLNLSMWSSQKADIFLEKARKSLTAQEFEENLSEFEEVFMKEKPAILLLQPPIYLYVSPEIKGLEIKKLVATSQLYSQLNACYLKTKRVFVMPRWRNW